MSRVKVAAASLLVAWSTPFGRAVLLLALVLGVCAVTGLIVGQHRHDLASKAATKQTMARLVQAGPGHELDAL